MGRDRSRSPSRRHDKHRRHHDDPSRDEKDEDDRKRRDHSDRDHDRHERKRRRTPEQEERRHRDRDGDRDGGRRARSPSNRDSDRHSDTKREQEDAAEERRLEDLRRARDARDRNFRKQEREKLAVRSEKDDVHYQAWLAKEDDFMLIQAKKRAVIRVREGREKPIDSLVINLNLIEGGQRQRILGDDEFEGEGQEFYITEPDELIKPLSQQDMTELKKDIEEYLKMEKSTRNQEYWKANLVILNEYQTQSSAVPESRAVSSVAGDIDALLGSKSHDQLLTLESQVQRKLSSDEPVDVDYWQQLLRSLKTWKARARLREFHAPFADRPKPPPKPKPAKPAGNPFSPENFADNLVHDDMLEDNDAFTAAAHAMFDPETTRIVEEGVESEETFNVEDEGATKNLPPPPWANEHRPRKPKFFNRVVMGYEWNKYNQTHYDESNPPPKVVQGYKFNIFYPNLVDSKKAPTYKVERNRQKRRYVGGGGGTSAGEDETCIIRFIAGAPYLDVAFRIIDRDWDYSSRFNRGFKSSFEKGILQLHFQFKKVFYRK